MKQELIQEQHCTVVFLQP